jgi:Fe2+ or Zn2+ uptake regulation protein
VHRATVYRTLDTLSALGVVSHVHLGHGPTAYHLASAPAHVHAQCRTCGRVVELPPDLLDPVRDAAARVAGFRLAAEHVALSGTCADCAVSAADHRVADPHAEP